MIDRFTVKATSFYEKTKAIVEKTESRIINFEIPDGFFYSACRFLVFPLKYIQTGFSELFRPASVGSFFAFALMLLSPVAMNYLAISKEHYSIVFNLIMILPAVLIVFAVPTTFMSNGVKLKNVKAVVDDLKSAGFSDSDDIDLFEKNVERFLNRVDSRVNFYRWVIGVFWALYLIILNMIMRLSSDQQSLSFAEKMKENLSSFSIILVAVSFFVILIIAYKRASELLFNTLEIGCTEYRSHLLQVKREKELQAEKKVESVAA